MVERYSDAALWRLARRATIATVVPMALLAAACVASQEDSRAFSPTNATRLFSTGYKDINEVYIDEVSMPDLVVSGLAKLSGIDPKFSIVRQDSTVTVAVDGTVAQSFPAPRQEDIDAWGDLTAAALDIGLTHSRRLGNEGSASLYETVFDGVLGRLDGFSRYAGREEAQNNRASREGFGGIGVRIRLVDDGVRILNVMENTPAERAGLRDDDVIVAIDGEAAIGLSQREIVQRLRGPMRSSVNLTVRRPDRSDSLSLDIKRGHIVPQTITYRPKGNVAYIKIAGFNQNTTRMLRLKLIEARDDLGDGLAGYVLDLRGNPGGLLDQAVEVSDLFVSDGRLVSTHGRHPDSHQYFEAEPNDEAAGKPVVVLINGNSASASEIVAAALQDSGRAVLIGSNSYGKGTVQTVLRLPNDGELTLTWARFHAPSGYALDKRGVLPDICVEDDNDSASEILAGLRRGLNTIPPAIRQVSIDPGDAPALNALRARCPAREGTAEVDLEVAIGLLSDGTLYQEALAGGKSGGKVRQSGQIIFN